MKQITVGVLAHVDAGKTTLCEALLYRAGAIRKLGRVDHRDSWFDTHALERARGITIFSKQAAFTLNDSRVTLLDTPGHVDFGAEAERTLSVLDCAVLVISGSDGVQPHTETLWRLLQRYGVPTVVFVTKMDLLSRGEGPLMKELQSLLCPACVNCSGLPAEGALPEALSEDIAALDEALMERYLDGGAVTAADAAALFQSGALLPCFFGSGLRLQGIDALLSVLCGWVQPAVCGEEFAARVYKISRDAQGARLTHLKVTGGQLKVRDSISYTDSAGVAHTEKVTQLRIYSGEKFSTAELLTGGTVAAVAGLEHTFAGQGLGAEGPLAQPVLEPVLGYRVILPEGVDSRTALQKLAQLEEEDPLLRIVWQPHLGEIHIRLMGEIQTEVLQSLIKERFGMDVHFDEGQVLYKETILGKVEGVGHFEPLRHYAEVHLLLEPLPRGSGVVLASSVHTDKLALNWQRLILYNLEEKQHLGVLGGFPLTDVKITLCAGKAHLKHTEGGDFRQAALRAVRQGLMQAKSCLLEPVYRFTLTLPTPLVGRALGDIRLMGGSFEVQALENGDSVVTGRAPVGEMQGYASVVASYTGGRGRLSCVADGYEPCHNEQAVLADIAYDPERDMENTPDSVFCRRGAGYTVKWNEVEQYMHLESSLKPDTALQKERRRQFNLDEKALEELMEREFGPIRRREYGTPQRVHEAKDSGAQTARRQHLLVDGYNVLFDWPELKDLAARSLDLARTRLMDLLADYRGFTGTEVVLVFDAYRSADNTGKRFAHHGIEVVYTEAGQTADAYLERMAQRIGRDDMVRVVSNDILVGIGAAGAGVQRMSCKVLLEEMERVNTRISQIITERGLPTGQRIGDLLSEEELEEWRMKLNS
ncbi:MAG: TetM/TetW/TetO/TetS family tetracycline resistance ribosomal protection protein [Oscillospiraceae bacterium]|nr:TetM/TetW/TetO/TetS family tetracycline resistance ribosomal protection protein [Oscillospiraceae bacterium]